MDLVAGQTPRQDLIEAGEELLGAEPKHQPMPWGRMRDVPRRIMEGLIDQLMQLLERKLFVGHRVAQKVFGAEFTAVASPPVASVAVACSALRGAPPPE